MRLGRFEKTCFEILITAVKKRTGALTEFDEALWGTLVDYIVVHGRGDMRVVFRDGSEIRN